VVAELDSVVRQIFIRSLSDLFFLGFGLGPRRWCELLNFGDLGGR
jgi:hypothetical protein